MLESLHRGIGRSRVAYNAVTLDDDADKFNRAGDDDVRDRGQCRGGRRSDVMDDMQDRVVGTRENESENESETERKGGRESECGNDTEGEIEMARRRKQAIMGAQSVEGRCHGAATRVVPRHVHYAASSLSSNADNEAAVHVEDMQFADDTHDRRPSLVRERIVIVGDDGHSRSVWGIKRIVVFTIMAFVFVGMMWLSATGSHTRLILPTLRASWENVVAIAVNSSMASVQIAVTTLRTKRFEWPTILLIPAQLNGDLPAANEFYDALLPFLRNQTIVMTTSHTEPNCTAKANPFANATLDLLSDQFFVIDQSYSSPPSSSSEFVSMSRRDIGLGVRNATNERERRMKTATNRTIMLWGLKIEQYNARYGHYPASLDDPLMAPGNIQAAKQKPCVVQSLCRWVLDPHQMVFPVRKIDGWGRPLRYRVFGHNSFNLISDGPDKRPYTHDDISITAPGIQFLMSLVWSHQFNVHNIHLKYAQKGFFSRVMQPGGPKQCYQSDLNPDQVQRLFSKMRLMFNDMSTDPERDRVDHLFQFWANITEFVWNNRSSPIASTSDDKFLAVARLVSIIHMWEFQNEHMDIMGRISNIDEFRNSAVVDDIVRLIRELPLGASDSIAVLVPATRVHSLERQLHNPFGYEFVPMRHIPPQLRLRVSLDAEHVKSSSLARARELRWLTKYDVWYSQHDISAQDKDKLHRMVLDELRLEESAMKEAGISGR